MSLRNRSYRVPNKRILVVIIEGIGSSGSSGSCMLLVVVKVVLKILCVSEGWGRVSFNGLQTAEYIVYCDCGGGVHECGCQIFKGAMFSYLSWFSPSLIA